EISYSPTPLLPTPVQRKRKYEDLAILPAPIQVPAADVHDQPDRNRGRVSAGNGAGAACARVLQFALRGGAISLRPDGTDRAVGGRRAGAHVLLHPAADDQHDLRLYLRSAAAQEYALAHSAAAGRASAAGFVRRGG